MNGHWLGFDPRSHMRTDATRLRRIPRLPPAIASLEASSRTDGGVNVFPIQVAILLSEPQRDFTGGEFVLTEQRPRMQSRPEFVPLHQATQWRSQFTTGPCKARVAPIA